jgi:hypothetical protein
MTLERIRPLIRISQIHITNFSLNEGFMDRIKFVVRGSTVYAFVFLLPAS